MRRLGDPLPQLRVPAPAVRIAYDVSPLSHPRAGVGNYVLGSLRGLVEAGADVVAFAPVSARGKRQVEETLGALDVERRLPVLPLAHAWRTTWSRVQRPAGGALARPLRRAALLRLDVPAAAQRSPRDDDPRPGAAALSRMDARPHRAHARRQVPARRAQRCRSFSATPTSPRGGRGVAARAEPERIRVAHPGAAPVFAAGGDRADLGRPYALTVATLEPRKNLDTLLDAHALLGDGLALAVVGAAGWGPAAAARPARGHPTRLRRRRRARAPLSRCRGVRLPVPIRGVRDPGARGDGERRRRRRLGASVARRVVRRRCCSRGSRKRRGDRLGRRRGAPASRRARAAGSRPGGTLHRRAQWATPSWLRTERRLRDCARESRHRRIAATPDARRHGALPARPAAASRAAGRGRADRVGWIEPRRNGRPRCVVVPARAAATRARARRAALPELPCAAARLASRRRQCARPRRARASAGVQPLDAQLQPRVRPAGGARRRARDRAVRVHEARARRAARIAEERVRVVPPAVEEPFVEHGARADGDYVLAVGTVEPRKNLPRLAQAARLANVELRVAGARGWGDVDLAGDGVRCSASCQTRSSRGSTEAPSASRTRRSTRGSAFRCSRRSRAERRS